MSTQQLTFAGLTLPASGDGPDRRHVEIREYILSLQRQCEVPEQWNGRCARALSAWLKSNPHVTIEQAQQYVLNKFLSDEPRGDSPCRWLPDLSRYAEGPLNEYRRLKRPDWRAGYEGIR